MFFSEMNASKKKYIVEYKTRYAARRIPITKLVVIFILSLRIGFLSCN